MADEQKKGSQPVPIIRGADFKYMYAQGYRLRLYPQEATITFSFATDRPPTDLSSKPTQVIQEEVAVTMSYVAFRALASELGAMMDELEKIHGPIELPAAMASTVGNIANIVRNVHGKPKDDAEGDT